MSVNDMIKKSVLNSFSQYNVPKMALALLVALLVGIVIYCVYRRFYTGVVYSRSFAVTLVGMCVLTCMVTLAISTNIVISLGMVGALSIVRYRTAVKDPMDLLYLFWAITSGIAAGAGMYLLVVVAGAVMIGDHRNDVMAATGAGVPCIFAGWGYGPLSMADGAPVAASPHDLPAMIEALALGFREPAG